MARSDSQTITLQTAHRDQLRLEQLTTELAGVDELTELSHELRGIDPGKVVAPHDVEHGALGLELSTDELAGLQGESCRSTAGSHAGNRSGEPSEER